MFNKSTDRSKMRGNHNKWVGGKYNLGCALFVDLLKPCFILSKVMQNDNLDVVEALSSVINTIRSMASLFSYFEEM